MFDKNPCGLRRDSRNSRDWIDINTVEIKLYDTERVRKLKMGKKIGGGTKKWGREGEGGATPL
jgi:hypothetical protein